MDKKNFIPENKKLLDPRIDSTFKSLFTREDEKSRDALKHLVGAIIGHEPKSVEVMNNELPAEVLYAKDIRLDLQCRMSDGERINIEMQTCMGNDNLKARSLYYGCRMLSGFDMQGKYYNELPRVYQVMFTDFTLFDKNDGYMQTFTMRNGNAELVNNLKIIFIQMPLVKIGNRERESKNFTEIEKWVIFLKYITDKSKRELLNSIMDSSKGIREAGEILMTISDDEREWAIQESRYKGKVDYESGLLASHAKGVEEGIEKGRAEGREESKIEYARGMKAKNLPIEMIAEITGLTAEQVEAL